MKTLTLLQAGLVDYNKWAIKEKHIILRVKDVFFLIRNSMTGHCHDSLLSLFLSRFSTRALRMFYKIKTAVQQRQTVFHATVLGG